MSTRRTMRCKECARCVTRTHIGQRRSRGWTHRHPSVESAGLSCPEPLLKDCCLMLRILASLSAATLFAAGTAAQCLDVTSPGTLIPGTVDDDFVSTHIPLGFTFP